MSFVTDISLTGRQRDQLKALLAGGAVSADTALGPYDEALSMCSPLVMGKLRDLSLADSRVVRSRGGSGQLTAYWLTPLGAGVARQIDGGRS